MSIINKVKNSLVDENIDSAVKTTSTSSGTDPKPETKKEVEVAKAEKKESFLGTTIQELKKVDWPTFKHTANWSAVVIIFSLLFGLAVSFSDHVFNSGLIFANCTSKVVKKTSDDLSFQQCAQNVGEVLIFSRKATLD